MGLIEQAEELDHPFYFYDLDALKKHLFYIQNESRGVLKIWYACKANPQGQILGELLKQGFGFDVASEGEFNQVLRIGGEAENILLTGPSKSKRLLRRLLKKKLAIVVCESLNQVHWLDEVAGELGKKAQVLLRVQLDWKNTESSVLGGDEITPFGLDPKAWLSLRDYKFKNLNFMGFHIFQWGNILSANKMANIWEISARRCSELASELGIPMLVLDLGGGIGLPYTSGEEIFDFKLAVSHLRQLKRIYAIEQIWMEFGRYAVGECGTFLTRVVDKKIVRGQRILVLESGINQLARPALVKEAFPCENISRAHAEQLVRYRVCGPLCTALDHLGDYKLPEETSVGDWLKFTQCGAYGFTESLPFFLGHSIPGELILKDQQYKLVREPLSASSYLKLF